MISAATIAVVGANFDCYIGLHDFVEVHRVPPTHTSNGRVYLECQECGVQASRTLFATQCQWSEWTVTRQPTCTTPGQRTRTCSVGVTHGEYQEIPALGHNHVLTIIQPTCTEYGQRIFTCSDCGDSFSEVYGEPTGHSHIEEVTTYPTCDYYGERTFTCEDCGDYYTEQIPKLTHDFGQWVVYMPPCEGIEGKRYRQCLLCGHQIWEAVQALPEPPIIPEPPQEPVPQPEPSFFGVQEAVVTGANVIFWIIALCVLFSEISYLLWQRRKTNEIVALNKFEESGVDGYEFI